MSTFESDTDLTVCVCTYNSEKYIAETLTSLWEQTFRNFRLLVVDDCSCDRTVEEVQAYIADKHWLEAEIVTFPKNRGTAYIRDFALRHVSTPLILFFDSDDIAKPELIETLYQKITSDNSLIAVSCYCDYMDANGHPLKGGLYLGPKNKEEFLAKAMHGKMLFFSYAAMYRRERAIDAGGYRQAEWFPQGPIRYEDMSEDVDLWGRMSDFYDRGQYIIVIPQVLFYYRKNTNSLSTGFAKARVMGQKLMYIKANQLRWRARQPEFKFEEYWNKLGLWKKFNFERRNLGSYLYRQACFAWVHRKFLCCAWYLAIGAVCTPFYPLEKYKSNFRKKH